jgi:hypothetical protein
MQSYKSLLVALFAVLFSPLALAAFSADMTQEQVAAEAASQLAAQNCQPWQNTKDCRTALDSIAESALDAGIESGVIIEALKTAGAPIGLVTAATAQVARRTLDVITPPKTGGGPGGGVSTN